MPPAEQGDGRVVITIGGLGTKPEDTGDYLQGYAKAEGNTWIPLAYPAAARQFDHRGRGQPRPAAAHHHRSDRRDRDVAGRAGRRRMAVDVRVLARRAARRPDPVHAAGQPGSRARRQPGPVGLERITDRIDPENTAYTVRDIAQRWDGWANWENWPSLQRVAEDVVRLFVGMFTDHSGAYDDVDVTTLEVRAVVGNTTYYVAV